MPADEPPLALSQLADKLGPRGFTQDRESIAPWLVDWRGRYRGDALALVSPASVEEVQAVVRICATARMAIVPQGGNSSMVGGATPGPDGGAILLSLRRMNAVRAVDADGLVAEAGVILSNVHDAAAAEKRRFPLSLAAKGSATVGGLISTNAGGTQVLRWGTMGELVTGLEAVLANGAIVSSLTALRKDSRGPDITRLLIGAEGTLGIVTAARLRLAPAGGGAAVAWIGVESPSRALGLLRFLQDRASPGIESFELIPDRALGLVLAHIPETRAPLATPSPWHVLIESRDGDLEAALAEGVGFMTDAVLAASEGQAAALWRIRESISEAERASGPALKHDISVPVEAMPGFIEEVSDEVRRSFSGAEVIAFGHLGDGNVHFNVQPPAALDASSWLDRWGEAVTRLVHDRVVEAGGSISAEHGIGQMKRGEYARTAAPARLAAQRAIKQALDPLGIMNPGKLLADQSEPA